MIKPNYSALQEISCDLGSILVRGEERLAERLKEGPATDFQVWCTLYEWKCDLEASLDDYISKIRIDLNEYQD